MEDKKIVDLYWARDEIAITETVKKYGRYCHYIAYQILRNDADAEEIVSDTAMKTWDTVPPNRPNPLKGYVGTISNRLSLNRYEAQTAQKRGQGQVTLVLDELAECVSGEDGDPAEGMALRDALDRFLSSLPKKTRQIFVRRYWYCASIADIARDFGMKAGSVTVLMMRTREKLKVFLDKEGFSV